MVGGPVAQLAVAVVTPGKHLTIWRGERNSVNHVDAVVEVKAILT